MKTKPSITLVGAGSLAMALAPALHAAGYCIDEIVTRGRSQSRTRARRLAASVNGTNVDFDGSKLAADVIWLCVSDGAIAGCARQFSGRHEWTGKIALHSSGAMTSDELAPLRRRGAAVASLHPMMTFVRRIRSSFAGVGFAVEGDRKAVAAAKQIARNLGGNVFLMRKSVKPLYHAWGAFGSPLLVMELALAERVAHAAGLSAADARKSIAPMVRRTIENYLEHGAAAAFSGPLVRGDLETVRRHLVELARVPGAREVYVALARSALRTLPVARRREIQKLLK